MYTLTKVRELMDYMNTNNNANTNIIEITAIYGLLTQINYHLSKLDVGITEQQRLKLEAVDVLKNWQNVQLHALRGVFE